jgi:hypothetical protein
VTRIYNARNKNAPPEAMFVDRRTQWGNPYEMFSEADRDKVCNQFEAYATDRLQREPDWLEPLRGKDLICWCAPKRCHASTLARLANAPREEE